MGGGVFTGVLTVRAGQSAVSIDPKSLRAQVGTKLYPVTLKPVAQRKRATMLVVDTSGSMGEAGMATVRSAAAAFLKDAPQDVAVGLVSFAGTAGVDVAPTKDRGRVQKAVNALRSRGETTLYDGVATAAAGLAPYDDGSILLLSDGGDTRSTKATKASATAALKRFGIRAEVIGFKTADSDNSVLKGFADAGGGTVAAAGNEAAVRQAFEAAARVLDSQAAFSFVPETTLRSAQSVVVTGTANGRAFKAQTSFDFGAAPLPATATPSETATLSADDAPVTTAALAPDHRGMSPTLLLALVAVFLGVLGLGAALVAPLFTSNRKQRLEDIEQYVSPVAMMGAQKTTAVSASSLSTGLVNLGDKMMEGRESTSKTMSLIERADLPLRAGEWWVLRIVSIVAGVAVALIFFRGGVGHDALRARRGRAPGLRRAAVVLRFLARRRCKKFEAQLPDVLTLVASSLSTGFSPAAGAGRGVQGCRRAGGEGVLAGAGRDAHRRRRQRRPRAHGAADGQRQHAVGRDGDPDPADRRWKPRRDPADDGQDAARARVAEAARQGAVGRGQALRVHPDRAAHRHLLLHACRPTASTSSLLWTRPLGLSCSAAAWSPW